jgi:monothiol glutaredoxin
METNEAITNLINENEVCLFMKGTPDAPQCGFSMAVTNVLKHLNVKFKSVNVLEDENIRQGIKDYSDWPTIPQLYIKKEFVGGCDIKKGNLNDSDICFLKKIK